MYKRQIKDSTRADYVKQIKFFEAFLNEVGKYPINFSDINLPLIKDYACVDMGYMASLTGRTGNELAEELRLSLIHI